MRCLVTAGPTYEKLDDVRRLTNMSTGRLGVELAAHLKAAGHQVVLLIGAQATWQGVRVADEIQEFSTTDDLLDRLRTLAGDDIGAVFHVAAVSDFRFGKVFEKSAAGDWVELASKKVTTRGGSLRVELVPTPKLIAGMAELFPRAAIVGWKYEAEGSRADVIARAVRQIREHATTACVANGPAYGAGFGLVDACGKCEHVDDRETLFSRLEARLGGR